MSEEILVQPTIRISNSDVVDLMLLSFKEQNEAEQKKFRAIRRRYATEQNVLGKQVFDVLSRLSFEKVKDKLEALFESFRVCFRQNIRAFATYEDYNAYVKSDNAEREPPDYRNTRYDCVWRLAGIWDSEDRYYVGRSKKGKVWNGIPDSVEIHPLLYKFHPDRYKGFRPHDDDEDEYNDEGEFDESDHYQVYFANLFGERSGFEPPVGFFKVSVPKELHAPILRIRELHAQTMKLQAKEQKLRDQLKDENALRLKINAGLTHSLLKEAGMAVEVEKVWASMSVTIEEALELASPQKPYERGEYSNLSKTYNPDDFKEWDHKPPTKKELEGENPEEDDEDEDGEDEESDYDEADEEYDEDDDIED